MSVRDRFYCALWLFCGPALAAAFLMNTMVPLAIWLAAAAVAVLIPRRK